MLSEIIRLYENFPKNAGDHKFVLHALEPGDSIISHNEQVCWDMQLKFTEANQ